MEFGDRCDAEQEGDFCFFFRAAIVSLPFLSEVVVVVVPRLVVVVVAAM